MTMSQAKSNTGGDQTALSRKLTALDGFVWAVGMQVYDLDAPEPCILIYDNDGEWFAADREEEELYPMTPTVLDLDATSVGGVLLEALGPGWCAVMIRPGSWAVDLFGGTIEQGEAGPTLAEACAKALVARGYYRRPSHA
jgi:hypothetical protein